MKKVLIYLIPVILFSMTSCHVTAVRYLTQVPPAIQIPETSQPLKITVLDERKNKTPGPNEADVEKTPSERVHFIFKERLAANNIKISDTDYASELKITIKEFKAVKKEGHWNSVVIISAATEANTQEYEAKNKEYNYNLNSAVKALSLSLSVAIDEIKWDKLYPVD